MVKTNSGVENHVTQKFSFREEDICFTERFHVVLSSLNL